VGALVPFQFIPIIEPQQRLQIGEGVEIMH
jgi:hypothetical protein